MLVNSLARAQTIKTIVIKWRFWCYLKKYFDVICREYLVLPTNHQHNSTNLLLHLTSSNQLPEKSIYTQNSYGMMNIKLYTKLNTILKLLNVSKVLNQFKQQDWSNWSCCLTLKKKSSPSWFLCWFQPTSSTCYSKKHVTQKHSWSNNWTEVVRCQPDSNQYLDFCIVFEKF